MANHGKYVIAERLLLLKQYLEANAGPHRFVERRELEAYLEEHGIKVEKKTLYADFVALENICGLQLAYDPHEKKYRLLNPPFEPYELRLLVDSVQSSKFITREKARQITAKVKVFAGKDTAESLIHENYVADRVRSMNDSVVKDSDRIHAAIKKDRKIGFRYFHYSPNSSSPQSYSKHGDPYIVSPYALYWNNGNYYLYAHDGKKFRYFRVDRMDRISHPLSEKREGQEEFSQKNLTRQQAKVFDMYSGPEYNVRIRFRNELADAVIDQFGKDIMMIPVDASHFIINTPIQISPPFFAWIATFGRRVKIQSPEPVVEKMREFLQRSMDMYKEDGEK